MHLYLVGNGPSLKGFDFTTLASEDWLGMNAAYRHWEKTGVYPRYYACFDSVVGKSHQTEIVDMVGRAEELGIEAFMLDDAIVQADQKLSQSPRVFRVSELLREAPTLKERVTTGSHSVVWAASLGYTDITLLGIDQNYDENVPGMSDRGGSVIEVTGETESPNYYFADYQRPGDLLNRPNPLPNVHATAWRRVMHHVKMFHPKATVFNASPISYIPGTVASAPGPGKMRKQKARDNLSVLIPSDKSFAQVLNALLPMRFFEVEDADTRLLGLGPAWKKTAAEKASNQGRWHLQVRTHSTIDPPAELGSIVQFFSNNEQPDISQISDLELLYDQVIHIHENRERGPSLIAILALRSDCIDQKGYEDKMARNSRLLFVQTNCQRLLWRIVRLLDVFRPDRT